MKQWVKRMPEIIVNLDVLGIQLSCQADEYKKEGKFHPVIFHFLMAQIWLCV